MTVTPRSSLWLSAKPDALISAASYVNSEWGSYGYTIVAVTSGGIFGSVILEVHHMDGSVFFVGSDQWGNIDHADTMTVLQETMHARHEYSRRKEFT